MSDVFKDAALRVGTAYGDLHSDDKQFALSPDTILVFLDIIREVVQLWANCQKSGVGAKQTAESPGPFQKLLLRRRVRDVLGNKLFREHGEKTIGALLKAGTEADPQFLQELIDEV